MGEAGNFVCAEIWPWPRSFKYVSLAYQRSVFITLRVIRNIKASYAMTIRLYIRSCASISSKNKLLHWNDCLVNLYTRGPQQ